jgi:hypothetical protein
MKHFLLAATAVVGLSVCGGSASADTIYDWAVSSDNRGTAFTSFGQFTLSGTTITAWSGTWDGASIIALLPAGTIGGNDNKYPLDGQGVGFSLSTALSGSSTQINLYGFGTVYHWAGDNGSDNDTLITTFTATPAVSSVPEPASLALLGAGLLGLGFARRRFR